MTRDGDRRIFRIIARLLVIFFGFAVPHDVASVGIAVSMVVAHRAVMQGIKSLIETLSTPHANAGEHWGELSSAGLLARHLLLAPLR